MSWLLLQETIDAMKKAEAMHTPPAMFGGSDEGRQLFATSASGVATITVRGVMTAAPSWFAQMFGGGNTTYPDIIRAIHAADADPAIKSIDLNIQSPGGSVEGSYEAFTALRDASKPTRAISAGTVASAAYMLAAQADEIVATSPMAMFGSVGVVVDAYLDEDAISITSTEAPDKRPDLKTDAGRATLRAQLDEIHAVMIGMVAEGRKTTADMVNQNFGRGGMVLAEKAVSKGMIDRVETKLAPTRGGVTHENKEASKMDLKTLKAQHPETYIAAVEEGKNAERDRVSAHLTMGTASGDLSIAVKAIESGAEMTGLIQAQYMAAGMNRSSQSARQSEAPADVSNPGAPVALSIEDQTVAALEQMMGGVK